jgi:hypothetical protein
MTKSPTAIEFKETVRHAFGYLGREFAFREVEPPTKHIEVNPFLVWFANATTLVQVEGINYGFAAQVILGPADAGDEWHATVPLWAIIKHRRPDLYEDALRSPGQLSEIRVDAHALREAASDVLRGDFRVFAAARAIIDAQRIHQQRTEQEETRLPMWDAASMAASWSPNPQSQLARARAGLAVTSSFTRARLP